MSKFNRAGGPGRTPVVSAPQSFVKTSPVSTGLTHQGGVGFARDPKSELYVLAVMNFVSEDTFYEKAGSRDARFEQLVSQVAVEDADWTRRFLIWLRTSANMRSASLVGAMIAAKAMVKAGIPGARQMVSGVLQRADEPGEALAYWLSHYGRNIPKPVKRGVADAATRLYSQYTLMKYDTTSHEFRFADVLDLTHPTPNGPLQQQLFQFALGRRHGRDLEPGDLLAMIRANAEFRNDVAKVANEQGAIATASAPHIIAGMLSPENMKRTGMTWEDVMSLLGNKVDKARIWEAMIPNMGYMALLRNLRGFIEAGIGRTAQQFVAEILSNHVEVAKSRQLPLRFVSAWQALKNSNSWGTVTWGQALEDALQHSLHNVPTLPGRTLVLVDISGSMNDKLSGKSELLRVQAAGLFGSVLALRNIGNADLYAYNTATQRIPVSASDRLLPMMDRFRATGGTMTTHAVQSTYKGHDRVVIVTDEQHSEYSGPGSVIPANVPLYTWNVGGYKMGHTAGAPNRHTFAGLTDQAFALIPLLERGVSQDWPF